jgi:phenylalanyl-tRNA synthetase beta chain
VYLPRDGQLLPDEPRRLGMAISGARSARSWLGGGEVLSFFDLKGAVELILERLGIAQRARFVALTDDPRFHPGRAATLVLEAATKGRGSDTTSVFAGVLGEIHPEVSERLGIKKTRALVAELELDALIGATQPARYTPISRFPAITQDLSMLVSYAIPSDRVAAAIRKYAGNDLASLTLIDVYEGERIEKGKRSMTYSLAFRASNRTLSDGDVNKIRAKIIKGLEFDVGAILRG